MLGLRTAVGSVMRSPPVTAQNTDSVLTVSEKMIANNIGAVIVVVGSSIVGMITERDIVERVVKMQKNPAATRAQDAMSSPVQKIDENQTVADAIRIMRYDNIRRLVVTRNGKLVGIVSERRLLDSIAKLV